MTSRPFFSLPDPPSDAKPNAVKTTTGFPSPAEEYLEMGLNLQTHLIQKPAATFFMRVAGESMTAAGLFPNDLLIVDRSLTPHSGHVIVAQLNGEFLVRYYVQDKYGIRLENASAQVIPIRINADSDFQVWGVVTHCIHNLVPRAAGAK